MKNFIKGLGIFILAIALVAGGYFAGQRVQIDSIISAMPKRTIDNQSGKPPVQSAAPDVSVKPASPAGGTEAKEGLPEERGIVKSQISAVDDTWSEVKSVSNTTSGEKLTLYTSAQKDGEEFLWDDSQKWVVEMSDGKGGYYTLYDKQISNGNVYFEVAERENGEKLVYVYTSTVSGINVNQYTRTDTGFTEKNIFNSGSVNRTFSSLPNY